MHQLAPSDSVSSPTLALPYLIEGLLFVASEPVSVAQLAAALDVVPDAIEAALEQLDAAFVGRGIRVQRAADKLQLVSAPEAAPAIERFLGVQASARLSAAALEVLAIIAYRQPLTRAQVDAVRGVDSGGVIRSLLARDLVVEAGRLETVGRPILYATTELFLRQFGLRALAELPPIELPAPKELQEPPSP